MSREFLTYVDIDASIESAWSVLADFANFRDWCPTLREVQGEPVVGCRLRLRLASAPGAEGTVGLSAAVRVVEAPNHLAWGGGVPGLPWLLDVHHWFRLEALGTDRCRLHHGERFQGLLLPLVWPFVAQRVEAGYPAFNAAFKRRCEAR